MGFIAAGVSHTAGEITAFMPVIGGFIRHAIKVVEPALGAATGWNSCKLNSRPLLTKTDCYRVYHGHLRVRRNHSSRNCRSILECARQCSRMGHRLWISSLSSGMFADFEGKTQFPSLTID